MIREKNTAIYIKYGLKLTLICYFFYVKIDQRYQVIFEPCQKYHGEYGIRSDISRRSEKHLKV